ncbi:MAG: permease-like cell division protein FtsX [Eubacteriales bacterium]
MRRYSLTYFIGQSIKGLWRNGVMSLASITVLMSCLTVIGAFSLLVTNINYNLRDLKAMNQIIGYVNLDYTDEQTQAVGDSIRALDNVLTIDFISKADALAEETPKYEENPNLVAMLENDNPYPACYVITYADASRVTTLQYQLENTEGIYKVTCNLDIANSIESLRSGITVVFMWFLIILFVVSIFVIINTIKLAVFSRRQEISVMRYVGATNWFIVLPFIFEGIIIGLLSATVAFFIEWYAYGYVAKMIVADYSMIAVLPFSEVWSLILFSFLGIGVVTGIIGSCLSLNKYLKA